MRIILFLACFSACSNNSGTDGGADGGAESDQAANTIKQSGMIKDSSCMCGFAMGTLSVMGGSSAMSDMMGNYSVPVPKNQPFYFTVTGDQHLKLIEQERMLSDNDTMRDETIVALSTQMLLKAFLPGFDNTKSVLIVGITKKTSCPSNEGAIVAVDPPQASSQMRYFSGGIPDATRTYAADGQRVIFYNLAPGSQVKLKLSWAMMSGDAGVGTACKMSAYPVQDPDSPVLKYTGNVVLEAGDAFTYERLFLE